MPARGSADRLASARVEDQLHVARRARPRGPGRDACASALEDRVDARRAASPAPSRSGARQAWRQPGAPLVLQPQSGVQRSTPCAQLHERPSAISASHRRGSARSAWRRLTSSRPSRCGQLADGLPPAASSPTAGGGRRSRRRPPRCSTSSWPRDGSKPRSAGSTKLLAARAALAEGEVCGRSGRRRRRPTISGRPPSMHLVGPRWDRSGRRRTSSHRRRAGAPASPGTARGW